MKLPNQITSLDAAMTLWFGVAGELHPVSGSLRDISP